MPNLKQTLIASIFATLLVLAGLAVQAPQTSALTNPEIRQCFNEHHKSPPKRLTEAEAEKFKKTACYSPGEACNLIPGGEAGVKWFSVSCRNLDIEPVQGEEDLDVGDLECSMLPADICASAKNPKLTDSGLWQLLILAFNILTAGVGIVAVGAIAYAGFLYTTAQGSADQVKKALEIIRNTVIGLVLFAGMFAIINFLVPGGIFKTSANLADRQLASWHESRSL